MLATVLWLMFRSMEYDDASHLRSGFVPLLELQAPQHIATLIDIIDWSFHLSFLMCSHVALRFLSPFDEENLTRQYTQRRSLALTPFCSNSGIPQFFIIQLAKYSRLRVRGSAGLLSSTFWVSGAFLSVLLNPRVRQRAMIR
jgi:hypothetical protein